MSKKVACISGVTGQVGSFLAEILLENGFEVHGLVRRSSNFNTQRIDHIYDKIKLYYGDLSDYASLIGFLERAKPTHFYNLGAQSFVKASFVNPLYTMDVTGDGVLRCLEAVKNYNLDVRFVTASSSEMFGSSPPPQDENTKFSPRSPYAIAKIAGYHSTVHYREAYNMFTSNAIMFNNESERRGEVFVTRKITRAVGRIKMGLQERLVLGNMSACRDWGFSRDYANALYLISEHDEPDDFVVATGQMHSVEEFCNMAFSKVGLDWKNYVEIDPKYFRATEVDALCGDSSKLREELNWEPSITFEELVDRMVEHDLELARKEKLLKDNS